MKKSSTLKFITNISFVPSICIHRSIILIFIEKSMLADFFPHGKKYFPVIFDFHFRENPRFCDEFQALLKVNGRNVQTKCQTVKRHEETMIFLSQRPLIVKGEGERERDGERERER